MLVASTWKVLLFFFIDRNTYDRRLLLALIIEKLACNLSVTNNVISALSPPPFKCHGFGVCSSSMSFLVMSMTHLLTGLSFSYARALRLPLGYALSDACVWHVCTCVYGNFSRRAKDCISPCA